MQPTRRHVLLGGLVGGVATVAACTHKQAPTPQVPSRDDRLRAEARGREQTLVDAYLAALADHPELTARLAPVLGEHAAHLAALGGAPEATPTSAAPSPVSPRPRAAVLRSLAAAERAAAAAHAEAAELAEAHPACSEPLAPLLASLAASEASHAVVL